jgi:hypothetical protein
MTIATNVTGWVDLVGGNPILAVYNMFNGVFNGWFLVIIFAVFQLLLIIKTRNLTLSFITTVMFLSLFAGSVYIKAYAIQFIVAILILVTAGILYLWTMK